jgi:hypothetical protein
MASRTGTALSAVLPLPPMEYDVAYMNNLIRILNFFIQQVQNPGIVRGTALTIEDRDKDTQFILNSNEERETLIWIMTNLPTSSTGLVSGQVWNNAGVLSIVP